MHAWLTHTTVLYICEFDTILSQKTPSPFDTQMQMTSLYLFLIISLKKKHVSVSIHFIFLYLPPCLHRLFFIRGSNSGHCATMDESLHAQQKKILPIFFFAPNSF